MFTKKSRNRLLIRIIITAYSAYPIDRKDIIMNEMNEVFEMLKTAGAYFIATCDDGQPRVRPFGTVNIYDGKFYIQTGKSKAVSHQLHVNPKLELCAMIGNDWLRVEATAVEDDSREARVSMLEAYPELKSMYSPDDGNTEVWYLRNVTATLYSFVKPPKVYKF